jgi:hypothetical protein
MTTTKTATCRFRGHVLQVSRQPHCETMNVGIDGWLVATAMTATTALHEICERLRLEACDRNQPTLPKRFRDRVHAIADGRDDA